MEDIEHISSCVIDTRCTWHSRTGERENDDVVLFHIVIIPTDGSECATRAVVIGADLAQKYDVKQTILHIMREIGRGGIIDLDQSGSYGVWLTFIARSSRGRTIGTEDPTA